MRVRNDIIAWAIVAAAVLSPASAAFAQGPAPPPVPGPSPARVVAQPAAPPAAVLPGVEHVFRPPAVIGEAWARALRTVLDGMKHVVDTQKVAIDPLRPRATPPVTLGETPKPPARPVASPSAPSVPAWRAVWLPAKALREAVATSPVQVGPVSASPPTEAGRDTRGEHAVLLGARMELPWMVP